MLVEDAPDDARQGTDEPADLIDLDPLDRLDGEAGEPAVAEVLVERSSLTLGPSTGPLEHVVPHPTGGRPLFSATPAEGAADASRQSHDGRVKSVDEIQRTRPHRGESSVATRVLAWLVFLVAAAWVLWWAYLGVDSALQGDWSLLLPAAFLSIPGFVVGFFSLAFALS